MPSFLFSQTYGLQKSSFIAILDKISPQLQGKRETLSSTDLREETKLSMFLMFARSNGVHGLVGGHILHQTSQSRANVVINEVAEALCHHYSEVNIQRFYFWNGVSAILRFILVLK